MLVYQTHMLHVYTMYDILTIIYLHLGDFSRANVGKYSSTMEHIGMYLLFTHYFGGIKKTLSYWTICTR